MQNELIKAIWLVRTNVGLPELKNIKNLVGPNAKVFAESIMGTLSRIPFIVQCGFDFKGFILKDAIEEEVECILNVSAHAKLIFWDLLHVHDLQLC